MSYLELLSEKEINNICSAMPHAFIITYFQKNPMEFSKIRPGFRPAKVSKKDAVKILTANSRKDFISSFLEKTINKWINEIQKSFEDCIGGGEDETSALVHTLSQSYFSDNITAYFKLTDKNCTDEQIKLISYLIRDYKDTTSQIKNLKDCVVKQKNTILDLEDTIIKNFSEIEKIQGEIQQTKEKLKQLDSFKSEYQNVLLELDNYKSKVVLLEKNQEDQREQIKVLSSQLETFIEEKNQLEKSILLEHEAKRKMDLCTKERLFSLMHPRDLEEFEEYLGYNFESLGITNDLPGVFLLKKHLTRILFCGIPMVVNRQAGINIAKCVSNALIGTQEISLLIYSPDISQKDIMDFISDSKRVILLDNFLGNYNETLLLPIIQMYGDRIIFLTISYERTLNYVSSEFMRYCTYINVNHLEQLMIQSKVDEKPSTIMEEEYVLDINGKESRYLKILNKILDELSLDCFKAIVKVHRVLNDDDIFAELIFNIIPYCLNVCSINPLSFSGKLQRYIDKSPYKTIIGDWFFNE